MGQMMGILGFLLALLALFFASEVMRRAAHRTNALETALMKANARIQKIEGRMGHVDRLAAEIRYQKKRQAETMTALANKTGGEPSQAAPNAEPAPRAGREERFTPSAFKAKDTA